MIDDESAVDIADDVRRRPPERKGPRPRSLNTLAQKRLGVHLRAMYESVVQQPIPDRFADLVARLEDDEPTGRAGG